MVHFHKHLLSYAHLREDVLAEMPQLLTQHWKPPCSFLFPYYRVLSLSLAWALDSCTSESGFGKEGVPGSAWEQASIHSRPPAYTLTPAFLFQAESQTCAGDTVTCEQPEACLPVPPTGFISSYHWVFGSFPLKHLFVLPWGVSHRTQAEYFHLAVIHALAC